jgi:SHS2 domain-containing protein
LVLALSSLLTAGAAVKPEGTINVKVEPGDRAAMAVDVLRELLYRFEVEGVVPESCGVLRLDPETGAEVEVGYGPYDPEAHIDGLTLKAVTLHEARFEKDSDDWVAQVVFDV